MRGENQSKEIQKERRRTRREQGNRREQTKSLADQTMIFDPSSVKRNPKIFQRGCGIGAVALLLLLLVLSLLSGWLFFLVAVREEEEIEEEETEGFWLVALGVLL
jgi:hypothetical protein